MRWRSGFAGLMLAMMSVCAWAQELYRLEPNDRIELYTTMEPSLQRTALVGPDGWLALPLIGHVKAAGLTAPELEQALRERLKGFFKQSIDLTVMLQPDEERAETIYVAGQVATPGAYPFRPGMTLLHGISMAGGMQVAAAESNEQRIADMRDAIARDAARFAAVKAQIARITAELSGQEMDVEGIPASPAIESERRILVARRAEEALLIKTRDETLDRNRRETESLQQQEEAQQERIRLSEKRLAAVSKLVAKGFTNAAQELELQSDLAEMRASALELQRSLVEAEGRAAEEVVQAKTALQDRRTQLEIEMRDAERERGETDARLADGARNLKLVLSGSPAAALDPAEATPFTIIRTVNGRPTEFEATELSPVEPGDLIQVGSARQPASRRIVSTTGANETVPNDAFLQ